jgi:hypothetical protein
MTSPLAGEVRKLAAALRSEVADAQCTAANFWRSTAPSLVLVAGSAGGRYPPGCSAGGPLLTVGGANLLCGRAMRSEALGDDRPRLASAIHRALDEEGEGGGLSSASSP